MTEIIARQKAQEYLDKLSATPDCYAILRVIEKSYGWVILWNTSAYAKSLNRRDGVIGSGPLVVENRTGDIHRLPSGISLEKILAKFEKEREG